MPKDTKPIGLAEFIRQVKLDLLANQLGQDDPAALFAVSEVEIEVGVTATRQGEGGIKGGLDLSIIGLGGLEFNAGGSISRENAQIVRIKLAPLLTKEQLWQTLKPDEQKRISDQGVQVLFRGAQIHSADSA